MTGLAGLEAGRSRFLALPAKQGGSGINTAIVAVLALTLLALLGFAVYFLVVQPRRRRAELLQAIPLLTSDDREDLERAEQLLARAVSAGLRRSDLADARFALAFVRAMLGRQDSAKYQEAATTVAELRADRGHDADSAYLHIWIQARLGKPENDDRVCELYQEHAGTLDDRLQTKLIVSISYLRKAARQWRRREVESALHYFNLVRDLGVLLERIPGQVNDLQVVYGVQAVFDNRMEEARQSFAGARARAGERGMRTFEADLGLVLCDWKDQELPQVDDALGVLVRQLDERAETRERSSADQADARPEDQAERARCEEEVLLRASAALLFVVSLLNRWLVRLPPDGDLPAEEHEELRRRVGRVLDADPENGDALLILGLIDYYFARTTALRTQAIDTLEKGTRSGKGITLPEVLDLIARERRLAQEALGSLDRYLTLVRGYLTDSGVPIELRQELKSRLERLARYRTLGEVDLTAEEHGVAPSIEDVRDRGRLLRERISRLVAPRLQERRPEDGGSELRKLLESLQQATKALDQGLESLQHAEQDLVVRTGEFLLPEDTAVEVAQEKAVTNDG